MRQRVRLTWYDPESKPTTEICILLHADSSMFTHEGTLKEDGMEQLVVDGRILFEDAGGEFTLKPKQIIEIRKLAD